MFSLRSQYPLRGHRVALIEAECGKRYATPRHREARHDGSDLLTKSAIGRKSGDSSRLSAPRHRRRSLAAWCRLAVLVVRGGSGLQIAARCPDDC